MDGQLCPAIQPPPLHLKVSPPSFRERSPSNPEIFQTPLFEILARISTQKALEKGGPLCH